TGPTSQPAQAIAPPPGFTFQPVAQQVQSGLPESSVNAGQATMLPQAFTAETLHDPTTGAWNMDTDFMTRRVLLRCDSTGDLYPVTAPSPIPHAFLVSQHTWHQRLGHPGVKCCLGKHVRLPFVSSSTVISSCFDIIHSDAWTSPIPSLSVVKPVTIRTVLNLAASRYWPIHQLDVKSAFLHGDLSKTVYMHQPHGFWDSVHPGYGTDTAYLLLYVDDIVLTASSEILLQQIIRSLHQEFSMTDLDLFHQIDEVIERKPSEITLKGQLKHSRKQSPEHENSLLSIARFTRVLFFTSSVTSSEMKQSKWDCIRMRVDKQELEAHTVSWPKDQKSYLQNKIYLIRHWNRYKTMMNENDVFCNITFANPKYLQESSSDKPRLYEIPYDTSDPANRFCRWEETVTLEKESRSKLDKDKVKPYNYTYQNSLYETFKPPSKAYLDQLERAKE
ncbi:ribonuclease H-like domain-containing protein, partial [Tanacetum coccineum]